MKNGGKTKSVAFIIIYIYIYIYIYKVRFKPTVIYKVFFANILQKIFCLPQRCDFENLYHTKLAANPQKLSI